MNIKMGLKTVGRFLDAKLPVILTGIGVAGIATTGVLGVKGGMKAARIIDEYDWEAMSKEDKRHVVLTEVAPCFAPAAVAGTASAACVIGAQVKNARTIAMWAGAYALKDTELDELKSKAKEFLGEKKYTEMHDQMVEERMSKIDPSKCEIEETGHGDTMFFDHVTGILFKSSIEDVRRAVNNINQQLLWGEDQTIANFYDELGLESGCKSYLLDKYGWSMSNYNNRMFEVAFGSYLYDNEVACIELDYDWYPIKPYGEM